MNTTVVIPERVYIGYVIGSGGRTIRSIEERTKTKIRWPYKSNPADRKFTIYGFGSHGEADIDYAVDVILQLVNGRLAAPELPILEKSQLVLSSVRDNAPERQAAPIAQQKPNRAEQPAMSSVPSEVLRDVLLPLSRWTLDDVQFTNRRFLRLITERISDVCLRQVRHACMRGSTTDPYLAFCVDGRPEVRNIPQPHQTTAYLFSLLMQVLRSSRVEKLVVVGPFDLTPELATLVLQTPIVVHDLRLSEVGCAELTPTQFQEVFLHFAPMYVDVTGCRLRACQLTDEFIRALSKCSSRLTMQYGVRGTQYGAPVDGGSFCVTDDAVVDFCAQQDVGIGDEGEAPSIWEPHGELILCHGSFTKALFKRLVEASTTSKRTQMIRIDVSPIPQIEDEHLQDFAQHLSYRKPDRWGALRVYDFPDEQDGMHLQIVLRANPSESLTLVRARRPNRFFYEQDE